MLKSLIVGIYFTVQRSVDIKNRPKIPIPDEDPYSEAGNSASSSGSSGLGGSSAERIAATAARDQLILRAQQNGKRSDKPPKLPPRDNMYHQDKPKLLKVNDLNWSLTN